MLHLFGISMACGVMERKFCLLWCYFPRQQIEQEVEHIREAHRLMEAGTVRRGRLEKALRSKLEEEVRRLKEETISLKGEQWRISLNMLQD